MVKIYTESDFEKDLQSLESMINYKGGAEKKTEPARHFKIVELNGKEVDFGSATVPYLTRKTSKYPGGKPITDAPSRAAKKLLGSIAKHKGLEKKDKLKLHATYVIKETTREKKDKKMHGPYVGKYKELTNAEKKTAVRKTKNGKLQEYTMKANVHLKKEKEHEKEHHKNKEHEKEHHKNKEHKKEHHKNKEHEEEEEEEEKHKKEHEKEHHKNKEHEEEEEKHKKEHKKEHKGGFKL